MSSSDPSVPAVLDTLRAQFPAVPFLALGQTVLWDEPTKAVWRRLLDRHLPDAKLVGGVHDTDYFAKMSAHVGNGQAYVALPHDDGQTRDLWSAAGEMSALFGSESVPTRAMFLEHGVPFDWLAKIHPGGREALLAEKTAAWGWRGIVQTQSHNVIARDVPVKDIGPALLEQLDWAFRESLACLADDESRARAEELARTVRSWVTGFLQTCGDDCRLSDLYETLLPRLYALLLQSPPAHFETTTSLQLFRFNRQTCGLPRFALLSLFLDPQTRETACRAYDKAVAGSGIYTLDAFGEGAIPFDLVIPERGRGTLRLTTQGVIVETTPTATDLCDGCAVESLSELAALTERVFGPNAALVGKAVTLADMIAAEFLVVFHETASGYTNITQAMNAALADAGLSLPLHPLVRLSYPTWDALTAAPASTEFRLPPHLARAFGTETVTAPEFAARWREVVETQRRVLRESAGLKKTRDLMLYLDARQENGWCDRLAEYESALATLKAIAEKSETLRDRIEEHASQKQMWQRERAGLEQRKGDDWRANMEPLRRKIHDARAAGQETSTLQRDFDRQVAIRATAFDEPIARCRERIRATDALVAEFRRQRRLLERGPEAAQARAGLHSLTHAAQLARLDLVRDAFLTVESLEHTHLRPTSWWLPLVDPSGQWFDAIVNGTKARLESLAPEKAVP